eukprot:UN22753
MFKTKEHGTEPTNTYNRDIFKTKQHNTAIPNSTGSKTNLFNNKNMYTQKHPFNEVNKNNQQLKRQPYGEKTRNQNNELLIGPKRQPTAGLRKPLSNHNHNNLLSNNNNNNHNFQQHNNNNHHNFQQHKTQNNQYNFKKQNNNLQIVQKNQNIKPKQSNTNHAYPQNNQYFNGNNFNKHAPLFHMSPDCERHIRQLLSQGVLPNNIRMDVCGRHSLSSCSKVVIYSNSQVKWFCGIVTDVLNDPNSGTWLKIEYGNSFGKTSTKLVKRFDKEIMPFPEKPDTMSVQDFKRRNDWIKGDMVQVRSVSQNRWINSKISSIDYDHEGEWLRLQYFVHENRKAEKQVKRHSEDVRHKVASPMLPIPVQPSDPVIAVTVPLDLQSLDTSSNDSENNIPVWARK